MRGRRELNDSELKQLLDLLNEIPKFVEVRHDWVTPQGEAFLTYARHLFIDEGVPIAWMGERIREVEQNFSTDRLQNAMTQLRMAAAKRRKRRPRPTPTPKESP